MKQLLSSFVLLIFIFAGCNQPAPKKSEPSWVLNPNQNGKIGAIGVAGKTYEQTLSSQRKLAITRALDELTLQQGVKVDLQISKSEVLTNDNLSTKMDTQSDYSAKSSITAHIEDVWKDKQKDLLYIWMVID